MSTGKGRIPASVRKVEIRASTGMVESGRVPRRGRNPGEYRKSGIRASIGEGLIRASIKKGRILASDEKVESGQVTEIWDPSEYLKRVRVSTGKVEIRASTGKGGIQGVTGR